MRSTMAILQLLLLSLAVTVWSVQAFVVGPSSSSSLYGGVSRYTTTSTRPSFLCMSDEKKDEEDSATDEEGSYLAAEFSKFASSKGIELSEDDLLDEESEDEDDELDERVDEVIGEIEKLKPEFVEKDNGGDATSLLANDKDTLDDNVTLTNDEIYSEVKERVLDTAGGFAKFVGGVDEEDEELLKKPKEYKPPETVPDSGLTAGEVVELVLQALLHNDVPTKNKGLEILFGYSSSNSQIKKEVGLTPEEYGDFLKETEYKVLFDHQEIVVEKGDYSFDGKKAFYTARLRVGTGPKDFTSVNFILSTAGHEEEDCWLIDSMLIRPQAMRRRRRK